MGANIYTRLKQYILLRLWNVKISRPTQPHKPKLSSRTCKPQYFISTSRIYLSPKLNPCLIGQGYAKLTKAVLNVPKAVA